MKLAKTLLFATMLVGISAHAGTGNVNANCANSSKSDSLTKQVGLGKFAAVFGSTAAPTKRQASPPPKTGR